MISDVFNSLTIRAQGIIGGPIDPGPVPRDVSDLNAVLKTVFTTVYSLAGVVCFGFIVWGGYYIIMSQGEPEKLKKGSSTLSYAVIGLVAVVCTGLIFNFVGAQLGVGQLISVLRIPTL